MKIQSKSKFITGIIIIVVIVIAIIGFISMVYKVLTDPEKSFFKPKNEEIITEVSGEEQKPLNEMSRIYKNYKDYATQIITSDNVEKPAGTSIANLDIARIREKDDEKGALTLFFVDLTNEDPTPIKAGTKYKISLYDETDILLASFGCSVEGTEDVLQGQTTRLRTQFLDVVDNVAKVTIEYSKDNISTPAN